MLVIVLLQIFLFGCVIGTVPVETRPESAVCGQQVIKSQNTPDLPEVQPSRWG